MAAPLAAGWTTWWAPRPAAARQELWQDFQAILVWLAGLQLLDLLTTLGALQHGAVEANPVAHAFLSASGLAALVAMKVAMLGLLLGLLPILSIVQGPAASRTLGASVLLTLLSLLAIAHSVVVFHNLVVLTAQLQS